MKERSRGRAASLYARIARQLAKALDAPVTDLFGPAEEADLDTLRGLGMPDSALDFYEEFAPIEMLAFGDVLVWDVPRLLEENQNYHPGSELQELGYVIVGGNRRGDLYCLDLGEGRDLDPPHVVLVPHDVETGSRDRTLVETQAMTVAESLDDFLLLLARGAPPG